MIGGSWRSVLCEPADSNLSPKVLRLMRGDSPPSDSDHHDRGLPITAAHHRLLAEHGAAALARRDRGFFFEQYVGGLELAWVAACGLWGLLVAGWEPVSSLLLLLAGYWVRNLGELIKLLLARTQVERWSETFNRDQEVWSTATGMMLGFGRMARSDTRYAPAVGVFLDCLLTGVCSAAVLLYLRQSGIDVWASVQSEHAYVGVLGVSLGVQLLMTVGIVIQHSVGSARDRPVAMRAGALGPGLIVVCIASISAINALQIAPEQSARTILYCFLGGILLLLPLYALGIFVMRRDVAWLRRYLHDRAAGAGSQSD